MVEVCYRCKTLIEEPKTLCLDCYEFFVYMVETNSVHVTVRGKGN